MVLQNQAQYGQVLAGHGLLLDWHWPLGGYAFGRLGKLQAAFGQIRIQYCFIHRQTTAQQTDKAGPFHIAMGFGDGWQQFLHQQPLFRCAQLGGIAAELMLRLGQQKLQWP